VCCSQNCCWRDQHSRARGHPAIHAICVYKCANGSISFACQVTLNDAEARTTAHQQHCQVYDVVPLETTCHHVHVLRIQSADALYKV
jgi:hypothetical protein